MNQTDTSIRLESVVLRQTETGFKEPLTWEIKKGEQWAIVGPNGAGKTLLADILQRRYALKEGKIIWPGNDHFRIKSIAFKDIYSLADYRNSYYQQRWHSTETDDIPFVSDLLSGYLGTAHLDELLKLFGVSDLLSKKLIFLSSGELRKFLIIHTLLLSPSLLILDNPFIGLDRSSRLLLVDMLEKITGVRDLQIILLLSDPEDIPSFITDILPLKDRFSYPSLKREEFLADQDLNELLFPDYPVETGLLFANISKDSDTHKVTIEMQDVSIRYGNRTILEGLSWTVKNGEKWVLAGPNGSGKSTLLSLVYADNPQSYANRISLFDRKRGSGESIWEIKKRIGYVSPEMHLYYRENVPALTIVGSGFFDSVGLYRTCNQEQKKEALKWMGILGVAHLKERLFLTLSSGEQRLVLLARAFVKNPDLLILDEPLHGLDIINKKKVIRLIETYCVQPGKTLIYVTHYPQEVPACVDKKLELVKK